jgi:hypothetical protein
MGKDMKPGPVREEALNWERLPPIITKWLVYGVAEEDSDWLGSSTGPHTKEVWTGKYVWSCSKALISYGYKLPPL